MARQKLKPEFDAESVKSDLIETVCDSYRNGVSVRALAKKFELSPMKTRKILITGGVYSTDISTEVDALYKDGKTVGEIAELLSMTAANVNSYLPYERIIYNMDERSVEADRQQRYRDRKKGISEPVPEKTALPIIERVRKHRMIVIVGRKLRKILPEPIFDTTTDPFARHIFFDDPFNPPDPDRMIWCAEVTTAGREEGKKQGIVLENASTGFIVIAPLPQIPASGASAEESVKTEMEPLKEYRTLLETTILDTIRSGFLAFSLPEELVLNYTETIERIELVKGKPSTPAVRVEEFIKELEWKKDADPSTAYRVRSNMTSRKFGYSPLYRHVDDAVCNMLMMTEEERNVWMEKFWSGV